MKRKRSSDIGDEGQGQGIDIVSDVTREELIKNDFDLISLDTAKQPTEFAPESCPSSPSSDTKDGKLCDRCLSIDLRWLFTTSTLPPFNKPWVVLGHLGTEHEQSSCELCRLFYLVKVDCIAHAARTTYVVAASDAGFHQGYTFSKRILCVCCKECKEKNRWYSPEVRKVIGLSKADDTKFARYSMPVMALELKPSYIDFGIICGWIERCEKQHLKPESCVDRIKTADFPHDLKLIDCNDRTIVTAQPESKYCALSYVWGSSEHSSAQYLRTRKRLPSTLPQTIEDAIKVTKELGFRYLWIDRYCINQKDKSEKHTQISQMNLIYRNSYVTIVAAAGSDPSFGLPGVSSTPRHRQSKVQFGGLHLISFPNDPYYPVVKSSWMTRGWTFQEGFFSARRLIFTSTHVYFECREASAFEYDPRSLSLHDSKEIFHDIVQKYKRPWDIQGLLAAYSKRKLSYHTDAINAFEGAINDFGREWNTTTHYWGVLIMPPVLAGPDGGIHRFGRKKSHRLLAGLCWRSSGKGKRRTDFPSWSWAGRECPISDYHPELGDGLGFGRNPPCSLDVFIECSNGQLKKFEDVQKDDQLSKSLGKILRFNAIVVPLRLGYRHSLDVRSKTPFNHVNPDCVLFQDEKYMVSFSIQLLCRPHRWDSTSQDCQEEHSASKIYGILMSQEEYLRFGFDDSVSFFLIVEDLGQSFRRIGHFEVSEEAKVLRKSDDSKKQEDVNWRGIHRERRRDLIFANRRLMSVRLE